MFYQHRENWTNISFAMTKYQVKQLQRVSQLLTVIAIISAKCTTFDWFNFMVKSSLIQHQKWRPVSSHTTEKIRVFYENKMYFSQSQQDAIASSTTLRLILKFSRGRRQDVLWVLLFLKWNSDGMEDLISLGKFNSTGQLSSTTACTCQTIESETINKV